MARSKRSESQPTREKVFVSAQEIEQDIKKLKGRVAQVEELKKEGLPYRDAQRVKAEFQIRETIRDIYGEKSPEFQDHRHHRISSLTKTEIAETVTILQDLISDLEERKLDVLSGRRRPSARPPVAQSSDPEQEPAPVVPAPAIASFNVRSAGVEKVSTPSAPVPPIPSSFTDNRPRGARPSVELPSGQPASHLKTPAPTARVEPSSSSVRSDPPTAAQQQARPSGSGADSTVASVGALGLIRKICTRFHAVARQLRQRREDRATLEVEDEHDVRDVLNALLSLEFEDISTEEWTPKYVRGSNRMDLVLKQERIVIVAKKTRPGLGAREIADQLTIDSKHYAAHPGCKTLFCFIYDPEGRIGNPRRIEADLTSVSDERTIEVLISPK